MLGRGSSRETSNPSRGRADGPASAFDSSRRRTSEGGQRPPIAAKVPVAERRRGGDRRAVGTFAKCAVGDTPNDVKAAWTSRRSTSASTTGRVSTHPGRGGRQRRRGIVDGRVDGHRASVGVRADVARRRRRSRSSSESSPERGEHETRVVRLIKMVDRRRRVRRLLRESRSRSRGRVIRARGRGGVRGSTTAATGVREFSDGGGLRPATLSVTPSASAASKTRSHRGRGRRSRPSESQRLVGRHHVSHRRSRRSSACGSPSRLFESFAIAVDDLVGVVEVRRGRVGCSRGLAVADPASGTSRVDSAARRPMASWWREGCPPPRLGGIFRLFHLADNLPPRPAVAGLPDAGAESNGDPAVVVQRVSTCIRRRVAAEAREASVPFPAGRPR